MSNELPEAEGAGEIIHLEIDGEVQSVELEEGISDEERREFIDSMLGIDPAPEPEIDHPELAVADISVDEYPEPEALRLICKIDGCDHTEVFDSYEGIRDSDWTDIEIPVAFAEDMTEIHYAFCQGHSLSEEEGYNPEEDFGSHEFEI